MLPVTLCPYGFGRFFCRRVGSLASFPAGPEGIDLSHQSSAGRSYELFLGLHIGVLAAQIGELVVDALGRGSLPFQFPDLQLQSLTRSSHAGNGPAHMPKRHEVPLRCGIQTGLRDPEPDLAQQPA
ncbi:MAG TPA: hypothetical protein VIX86_28030 [Streptosporangiaceae bacterium]